MAEESSITRIEKLNGSNFQSWKHDMKFVLMEKGLWGLIDGSETDPGENATPKIKSAYKTRSEKAYSSIALSIEKSIKIHVTSTENPKEAWEILHNQFSFVSMAQTVRITRRFYAATMKEDGDLQQHLTLMSSLAQQLRDLDEEVSPQKFTIAVLGSLPSSYDNFITSLNARNKNEFDWETIKGALLEEDMKRKDKKQREKGNEDALLMRGNNNVFINLHSIIMATETTSLISTEIEIIPCLFIAIKEMHHALIVVNWATLLATATMGIF